MNKYLNNKWIKGKTKFDIKPLPEEYLFTDTFIIPLNAILDNNIGVETILYLVDTTDFIYELSKVKPFKFYTKIGVAHTSYGSLCFIFFIVEDPIIENKIFYLCENTFDPNNEVMLKPFYDMDNQTHLHLFLLNKDFEQQKFFEFENVFNFKSSLDMV